MLPELLHIGLLLKKGETEMNISKLRTIASAYDEIIKADPDSAITKYAIRSIVNSGNIPVVHRGTKALFDINDLYAYLKSGVPILE